MKFTSSSVCPSHSQFPKCHWEDPFCFQAEGGNYEECWVLSDQTGSVPVARVLHDLSAWTLPSLILTFQCVRSEFPSQFEFPSRSEPTSRPSNIHFSHTRWRLKHLHCWSCQTDEDDNASPAYKKKSKRPRYWTPAPVWILTVLTSGLIDSSFLLPRFFELWPETFFSPIDIL